MIKTKKVITFGLVVLISLALGLRLYRIAATQTFLEDEGRDLLIVKRMVDTKKPVLLGPQTSIGSMYLGPFYYYFITPALIVAKMDPVGPAIFIALTGALTVYILFRVTNNWLGSKAAWIAAGMYAVMPLPVAFTRNSWNPDLAPLVALVILAVVDKIRQPDPKNIRWFAVAGFLTGILIQLHYMALIFVAIYGLLLFIWWFKSHNVVKAIATTFVGFVIAVSPFIVFELRNDWVNTRAITRFIQAKDAPNIRYSLPIGLWESKVAVVTSTVVGGLFTRGNYRPFDTWTPVITVIAVGVMFAGIVSAPLDKKRRILLMSSVFGSIALLGIYQENIHVHYLGYIFTLCYLSFAALAASQNKILSWIGVLVALVIVGYSVPVTWGNIAQGESRQVVKARAVAEYIARIAEGDPYNLVSSRHTSTTPYQYFAYIGMHPPTNERSADVFLVCQDEPCTEEEMNNRQIFITGPAHPALTEYVGHPLLNYIDESPEVVSNEHVSSGVWVAHLRFSAGQ